MTSLALLTDPARAAAPPFNSAFYATVATVIPVLYVALAFQGRSLQSFISTYQALASQAQKTARYIRPWIYATNAVTMLVALGAVLVIGAGGWGEALAIYALYQDQAGALTGQIVLASAVFLTIAVVAGPVLTFSKSAAETYLELLAFTRTMTRFVRTVSKNARQRHAAPGLMPPAEPGSEPGKTDRL